MAKQFRFKEWKGSYSLKDFKRLMNKFDFERKTRDALRKFLVNGVPYSLLNTDDGRGCTRQFIYKKLCAIEKKLKAEEKKKADKKAKAA